MTVTQRAARARLSVRVLFEPRVIAALFRKALGGFSRAVSMTDARIERCWPAGDAGLRFEWSIEIDGGRRAAIYGAWNAGLDRDSAAHGVLAATGIRQLQLAVPQQRLLLHSPDRDAKLPQLGACLDARSLESNLRAVVERNRQTAGRAPRCTLLGYKPARRAALRYDLPARGGAAFSVMGKTFRDERGQALLALHGQVNRALAEISAGRWRVPAPRGYIPELRLAIFEWVAGRSVAAARPLPAAQLSAAVDVLSGLHSIRVAGLPRFTIVDEIHTVDRWLTALRRVNPRSAARAAALRDRLDALGACLPPAKLATIHRDFYEKQLVWNGSTTTLLDLDTLAIGDPCLDLGNFLSHLYLRQLQVTPDFSGWRETALKLLDRYEQRRGRVERQAVAYYCAASLLRGGVLHSLRTLTRSCASALWRLARRILTEQVRF